jgi:hypothetical protein
MKTLALVVDERELSTIQAALLLLQEQIGALPEDLSEMMKEHGAPLTEAQVGELARRIALGQMRIRLGFLGDPPRDETLVDIERSEVRAVAKQRA